MVPWLKMKQEIKLEKGLNDNIRKESVFDLNCQY